MPKPSSMPKGLVFFSPDATPAYRRRRIAFAVICAAGFLSLIWPVGALVDGPRPLVLGLPLALAWIVLWLVVIFLGLLWLYRGEPPEAPPETSIETSIDASPEAPSEPSAAAGPHQPQ